MTTPRIDGSGVAPTRNFTPIPSKHRMDPMQPAGSAHDPLPSKAPALKRPTVFLAGLTLNHESWGKATDFLSKERSNGKPILYEAAKGSFHEGGPGGRTLSSQEVAAAKMILMNPTSPAQAPSLKQHDVAKLMSALASASTEAGKLPAGKSLDIDVVTHSAGGHDLRSYLNNLDDGSVKINNAVMIGPVSTGTVMADIGNKTLGRWTSWVPGAAGRFAREMKQSSAEMHRNSPYTAELNENFDAQRAKMKNLSVIATTGSPTPGPEGMSGLDGDGFVEPTQAALPGARNFKLQGGPGAGGATPISAAIDFAQTNHLKQVGFSGVIARMAQELGR